MNVLVFQTLLTPTGQDALADAETLQPREADFLSHFQTPFARVWSIEDWMPFNLKKLRAYLCERKIGRVTVKKRGSPLAPESRLSSSAPFCNE